VSLDWPDYTHGVVLTDGSVTDCPDWQEQVVGPGGVPVGGGGATYLQYTLATATLLPKSPSLVLLTTASLAIGAYLFIGVMGVSLNASADTATLAIVPTTLPAADPKEIQNSAYCDPNVALSVSGVLVLTTATTVTLRANSVTAANNLVAAGSAGIIVTSLTVIGPLTLI
jgi:hypothetical protein